MASESIYLSNCKAYCERKHLGKKRCMVPVTEVIAFSKVCTSLRHKNQHCAQINGSLISKIKSKLMLINCIP